MPIRVAGAGLCAMLVAYAGPVWAQSHSGDDGDVKGVVSAGAGMLPDYEGSKYYEATPYFEARINDGNYYARFEGGALRINLIDSDRVHAGPLMGFRRGRGDVASPAVSRMNHLAFTVTAGGFVEYEHVAQDPRAAERLTLSFDDGVIGEAEGWTLVLRGAVRRPLNFIDRGLIASLEADANWAGGSYMQTYFGIDVPDAVASGLPFFHADGGFKSAGVGLALDQFLSRKWSVGVRFHYARLAGDAKDSPITSIAGTPDQFFAGVAISYVL